MTAKKGKGRRLDKDRVTLRKGESQRADGIYDYRWSTPDGKRTRYTQAPLRNFVNEKSKLSLIKGTALKQRFV